MSTWPALPMPPPVSPRQWATARATAPTQAEIDKVVKQVNDIVKKAHVDMWVGKSRPQGASSGIRGRRRDGRRHKTSTGIESLALNLDVTTVDSEAPDVSAPSSVGTAAEFQTALIGLLGKVMGGAAAG